MILEANSSFLHLSFVSTTRTYKHTQCSVCQKREPEIQKTRQMSVFPLLPGAHALYAILQSLHCVIYLSPLNWNFHLLLAIKLSLSAARSLLMILLSPFLLGFVRSVLSRREKWTLNRRPAFTALGLFRPAVAMQQCEMLAQHDLDRVQQ